MCFYIVYKLFKIEGHRGSDISLFTLEYKIEQILTSKVDKIVQKLGRITIHTVPNLSQKHPKLMHDNWKLTAMKTMLK